MIKKYFTFRMLVMLLMSFSSGFPIVLILGTLQMWYAKSGINIVAIGALTLIGQPYAYKFIWAPIMDRYTLPFLGRRRGWILVTQIGLFFGIFAMAWFNPKTHPIALALMAVLVAFFSASQDISLDAYRTDLLTPEERGIGAAIWANGYRLAMVFAGAAPFLIAFYVSWRVAYITMSFFMLIGIYTTLFCKEPENQVSAPQSLKLAVFGAIGEFLKRPYAIALILFVIIYKLGDAYALSLSSPFYANELGFDLKQIAWIGKTFGTVASIIGLLIAGALMVRWKLYRSLMIFGWLQAISILGFLLLAITSKNLYSFAIVVFFEHVTGGMGTAAFLAFLMALCDHRYTATQYALFSAIMVIGRTFVGPIAGVVVKYYGWSQFFGIGFVIAVLGLFLLYWLSKKIDFNRNKII